MTYPEFPSPNHPPLTDQIDSFIAAIHEDPELPVWLVDHQTGLSLEAQHRQGFRYNLPKNSAAPDDGDDFDSIPYLEVQKMAYHNGTTRPQPEHFTQVLDILVPRSDWQLIIINDLGDPSVINHLITAGWTKFEDLDGYGPNVLYRWLHGIDAAGQAASDHIP